MWGWLWVRLRLWLWLRLRLRLGLRVGLGLRLWGWLGVRLGLRLWLWGWLRLWLWGWLRLGLWGWLRLGLWGWLWLRIRGSFRFCRVFLYHKAPYVIRFCTRQCISQAINHFYFDDALSSLFAEMSVSSAYRNIRKHYLTSSIVRCFFFQYVFIGFTRVG